MPRVSVLIPTYNRAHLISDAIGSVRAQTFRDYEIVVVDDGSTDGTEEALAGMPDVRCVRIEHAGISAARNRALAEAKGELVAFLDSDDLWAPEKLERQVVYLDAHPEAKLVFAEYEDFFDSPEIAAMPDALQISHEHIPDYLASALIKKELFDCVGLFFEQLGIGEDSEWTMRAQVLGTDMSHKLPEVLYFRRIHGGNTLLSQDAPRTRPSYKEVLALSIRNARSVKGRG